MLNSPGIRKSIEYSCPSGTVMVVLVLPCELFLFCCSSEISLLFCLTFKALDMYLSVAILRVPNGLDRSQILGDESSAQRNILDVPRTLQPNESSADLNSVERTAQNGLSGSMDSLSRNVSQGKQFFPSILNRKQNYSQRIL